MLKIHDLDFYRANPQGYVINAYLNMGSGIMSHLKHELINLFTGEPSEKAIAHTISPHIAMALISIY
ncbi:hypothetical protein A6M21_09045 [Desulfotomaculum copahuensis]|uniref:Uncharacterized protein n=1 Tax=Desulfotomaculum copahuensis TaxID=1838280 RepID=A0A1B7LFF1_9FIRM|nr:hypothetical protein A6M21_09045 [Desulfotomaculum copahuensis]